MTVMPTEREVLELPAYWLVTKNSTGRGKKLHVSFLSITSSRELKAAKTLSQSLQLLQGSQPKLILLHSHRHPLSHLIKVHMFIQCKINNINKNIKLYVVEFLVSILQFWNAFPVIPC
jgi:hypothetical protein